MKPRHPSVIDIKDQSTNGESIYNLDVTQLLRSLFSNNLLIFCIFMLQLHNTHTQSCTAINNKIWLQFRFRSFQNKSLFQFQSVQGLYIYVSETCYSLKRIEKEKESEFNDFNHNKNL